MVNRLICTLMQILFSPMLTVTWSQFVAELPYCEATQVIISALTSASYFPAFFFPMKLRGNLVLGIGFKPCFKI